MSITIMEAKVCHTRTLEAAGPCNAPSPPQQLDAERPRTPHPLHRLQRTAGNRAVQRLVQGRLRVPATDDPHELEAERVAARVAGAQPPAEASGPTGTAPCACATPQVLLRRSIEPAGQADVPAAIASVLDDPGQPLSGPPTPEPPVAGHSPTQTLKEAVWPAWVQRCGTGTSCNCDPGPNGDVHEQEADRTAERIVSQPEGQERVSRASQPGSPTALGASNPNSSATLVGQLGPGRVLPEWIRAQFETRLGADLGDVQLHTGDASHRAAESLHANAFTVGSHVGFRAGQFAPGTTEGQRLLAHEITHVLQQRRGGAGTGAGAPVQRQLAPEEAAGGGPPPLTGEQVQLGTVTLSQNPAQLRYAMEQLIINGLPMYMGMSIPPGLGSLGNFRHRLYMFSFPPMYAKQACEERPPDDLQCRVALKIRPILDPILDDLERECEAEVERFEAAARRNTVRTLDASERQARAEMVRYGITEKQVQEYMVDPMSGWASEFTLTEYQMGEATPQVTGLQDAATVLLNRRQAIAEKVQEQEEHRFGLPPLGQLALGVAIGAPAAFLEFPDERYVELGREIAEMKKDYNKLQDTLGAQYPALAAVSELEDSPEGIRTLAAGAGPEMAALIGARVGKTLANINKVRDGLWDDVNVWRLPDIMDITKIELGIQPGTIPAALVAEKIQIEKPGILNQLAIAALNVLALLLAAPTGGLSLAAMGAVNIGLAYVHVEEYLMAKALHGSALDQARALSQEDPSLFWLAVEIIGVGVGDVPAVAGAAYRAFRVLAPIARAAVVAEEGKQAAMALADLRLTAEELSASAEGVHDAALADNLVTKVGELRGGRAAVKAVEVTEEEARLLGASAKAMETEAAQAIAHTAVAAEEGSVTLSRAGWLFDCSSPCTIIREKFAQVLAGDPAQLTELAELEKRALDAATTLDAARAVDPMSEAAREAERAANAVSEDAAEFVKRLHDKFPETRPPAAVAAEDALFWSDVEPFVNKKLSQVGAPPGYTRFEHDGQTFLRRISGDDALYPKLTVDEDGVIRVGRATSKRISTPGALAEALGPRPLNHEAHHLVPDAVVRDHPLFEAARTRGSPAYNLDRKPNGAYLANTAADRIPGVSDHLPVHRGSHPAYNQLATDEATAALDQLVDEFGSLDKVPADRLTEACTDVEDAMRDHLDNWVAEHGDSIGDF